MMKDSARPIDHWDDYLTRIPGSGIVALGDKSLERVCAHSFLMGMHAGLNYLCDNAALDEDFIERIESLQRDVLEDAEKLFAIWRRG